MLDLYSTNFIFLSNYETVLLLSYMFFVKNHLIMLH